MHQPDGKEACMTLPDRDGFFMPGEFEPHEGCIIIWPFRPGSWRNGAVEAQKAFRDVIYAIAESEKVWVAAGKDFLHRAEEMLFDKKAMAHKTKEEREKCLGNIQIFEAETDDSWARDVGPTFVKDKDERVRCVNWEFNAWGGTEDGLYASWDKDNAFAKLFAAKEGYLCYDAAPFVMEGGAVHSDGEGTLLVTEACLLSKGRNPQLSKEEIESRLCTYLGAEKVLWLPRGIYQDETNEHVDNVCAFIRPGEVVLAWTDNREDPQYALSKACLDYLEKERDAKGRKITVHKLPIPDHSICLTREDVEGYTFEEGEDFREEGERLAASYVNFYFSNSAVVLPVFGKENRESDERAVEILRRLCPERKTIPIPAGEILRGGGNIHCITQQVPKGMKG